MLIGYARVSTHEQTLALQQDALKQAGCERSLHDTISGAKWTAQERVGLTEALEFMRPAIRSWCGSSTAWAAPSSSSLRR